MVEPVENRSSASSSGSPWGVAVRRDLLASIVVFLVALPLCMGIAIASGAPVASGLITGILGGLVVGWLAGCPLQVSGPAAGLAVIVYEIIERSGMEFLGLAVLAAGGLQVAAGLFRLGQWFRAVSPAVIQGMLAGIGILILASQFHVMVDDAPKGKGLKNVLTMWDAVRKAVAVPPVEPLEVRRERIALLRELGELHRRQVDLRDRIARRLPRPAAVESSEAGVAPSREAPAPAAEEIDGLGAEQQAIRAAFEEKIARILAVGTPQGNGAPAAAERVEQTRQTLAAAVESLRRWDLNGLRDDPSRAADALSQQLSGQKSHTLAALVGLATIGLIVVWGAVAPKRLQLIPPPLLAVALVTAAASVLVLPVIYVEVPTRLWEEIRLPGGSTFLRADWLLVLQSGLLLAAIASAETLLCCTAVDQLHSGPRTRYDRELLAQGVGNSLCGLLGGLPMTGVIVRSSANVQAGAVSRLSAVLHGVWLLVFVAFLAFLLQLIPTAALAAVLVYTGYKLVNVKAIARLRAFGWSEVLIYLATVVVIVGTDLLTGVLTGLALAAGKLLYTFSHLETRLVNDPSKRRVFLHLRGAATFIRLPKLAARLEEVPPSSELHVDFEHLDHIDHACLDLLLTWARQHQSTGGRLVLDWASLHGRFRGTREPAAAAESERAADS